jgi:hypothetical protein
MPKIRDRNFSKTPRYMVRLRNDRRHGWKQHFRGVVAEVIGYLEMLARNDPHGEYFVFAQVENIIEHCNRYKGAQYSRRAVELALEYLRKLRIVSGVVERKRLNQAQEPQVFTGRIVTPHYAMCETVLNGKYCSFKPSKVLPGYKWAAEVQTKNVGRARRAPVVWYAGVVKKRPVEPNG